MSNNTAAKLLDEMTTFSKGQPNAEQVRTIFEDAAHYLKSREVDIRFRIDTAWTYGSALDKQRMLDIGCGNGCISLQLLSSASKLTLMDISSNMLALAEANIQEGLAANVELRNENFAVASFGSEHFDLIVAVGVLAHVASPDAFLEKIRGLLPPGGAVILEFTDAFHPVGRVGRIWGWLKELIAPAKYDTNKYSADHIMQLCARYHLKVVSTFRYSRVPIPGFSRIVPHRDEFRLVRAVFGSCGKNTNAWLGNEYICLLKAE